MSGSGWGQGSPNLTFAQLEQLWTQAGGPANLAPTMAAIGLAESGGNPAAVNPKDNNGTQSSYGLWQISTGTHTAPNPNWSTPLTSAQLAVTKYNSQGLGAWGTYTSGSYQKYLAIGAKYPNIGAVQQPSGATFSNVIGSITAPIKSVEDLIKAIGPAVAFLTNPASWVRVGEFVVGGAMIVTGIVFLLDNNIGHQALDAGKTAGMAAAL
jgi:Lysozyme like domain